MCNKPPLRIMHAAAPGHAGGLESVLLDLMAGLRARGHEVMLGAVLDQGEKDHPVPRRAEAAGVTVEEIFVPPRGYVREYRALRGLLRAWQPELLHTHGYRADLLAGAAARHEGIPWVSTVHGFVGGGRKNRLYEWLQVRSYRRAQGVIAVSRPLRKRLDGNGIPPSRVHFIPNAWEVRPTLAREDARRALGVAPNVPLLGWVGRLSREKGADVFLNALSLLPDIHWHASILGSGLEHARLEAETAALGLKDRVTWHGVLTEASRYFSAFDLYVLSSRTEGTPIALFEAMGSSVPIVATSVGGVPDVVSNADAILVRPDDPRELAAAIRSALTDRSAAQARAQSARESLQGRFSPGPWIAAHEELYRQILSHPLPTPEA